MADPRIDKVDVNASYTTGNGTRRVEKEDEPLFPENKTQIGDVLDGGELDPAEVTDAKPNKDKSNKKNILKAVGYGAAALFGGGLLVAAFSGAFPLAALFGAVTAAGVLSSCTKDEPVELPPVKLEGGNINIHVITNITVELPKDISDTWNKIAEQLEELNNKTQTLIGLVNTAADLLNKIYGGQLDGNQKLDDITKLLNRILDEIQKAATDENANDAITQQLLTEILKKLETMDDKQSAFFNAILDNISNMGDDMKVALQSLLQAIEKNSQITEDCYDVLTEILKKLDDMNEGQKSFFTAVLKKIGEFDAQGQEALTKVLEAIKDNKNTITEAIEGLGDKGKAAVEELLKAINANTEVAKGSQDLLVEILGNLGKLGDKADEIIGIISNLTIQGGNVDLTKVTELLQKILDQNIEIQKVIDKTSTKLNEIENEIKELSKAEEYMKILIDIRNKITPCEGHTCDHTDLVQILLEMKVLIEKLKKDEDSNHEGILDDDDLGNIFG